MARDEDLRRTPLHAAHIALGARMAPFGGWDMPVRYSGILDEARAVRSGAGLFDVSHMGRLEIQGPGAAELLDRVLSSDVPGLRTGRSRYLLVCNRDGGIIDDCILYRPGEERFLLVPNAANAGAVREWLSRWEPRPVETTTTDATDRLAMIAIQGPGAAEALSRLTALEVGRVRPFRAVEAEVGGADALVARTGYTGEDGFELVIPSESADGLWSRLVDLGAVPCGLGARDVLRLEAGLPLHGNDIDVTTSPYEAGLGRFVDPDRAGYVAGEALRRIRDAGAARAFVGFTMIGRGVARQGHPIMDGPERIGAVTSGSYSPTLDTNIGMGYVPTAYSAPGARLQIDVRGRPVEAEVAALPFYSRRKSA